MLNDQQSQELCKEILDNNKEVMKDILALARQGLDAERFNFFRKEVFNKFGVSGLETSVKTAVEKYTDKR
jgi:hypothetical protein